MALSPSVLILRLEYPNLRVFNVHPGMAKSSVLRPELEIYARDTRLWPYPLPTQAILGTNKSGGVAQLNYLDQLQSGLHLGKPSFYVVALWQ